jgi:1,2-diacylglycerol 3-beta-galactosyltransferase
MSLIPERQRIVFLSSDTGGGHRSTAAAVIEALEKGFPGRYACDLVDVLEAYAPPPFNRLPRHYPHLVRAPSLWAMGYRLTDGSGRMQALSRVLWPYVRGAAQRFVEEQEARMYVSVHPLLISPILQAMGRHRLPFITIVSDLVSTHALWYDPRVDLCMVPSESAKRRALKAGLAPQQVRVIGLPVAQEFCGSGEDKTALRAELGWSQERPLVLIVGGGDGMGPLFETALAIDVCGAPLALAVVAGRNQALLQRLRSQSWCSEVFVYGFERRLSKMMRAADLLVTKAGPSTIAEALNAHLPMVLYSRLPGQEDGNVQVVVESGAGIWSPGPERTAQAVRALIRQPQALARAAQACRRSARPHAARRAADLIAGCMEEMGIQKSPPSRMAREA